MQPNDFHVGSTFELILFILEQKIGCLLLLLDHIYRLKFC